VETARLGVERRWLGTEHLEAGEARGEGCGKIGEPFGAWREEKCEVRRMLIVLSQIKFKK